jgi:hypothetical protein
MRETMPALNCDKLKKVLVWVSNKREEDPSLTLKETFRKAELTFDLSPKECDFIERNFTETEQ